MGLIPKNNQGLSGKAFPVNIDKIKKGRENDGNNKTDRSS